MRKLTVLMLLAVLAALGWGLFWLVGATAMEKALAHWFDERRAEGWRAEVAALDTRGFPSRFDTTFEGLDLSDPDTGVAWSAPLFQLLSLSYKPNHLIAVFPGLQRFGPARLVSSNDGTATLERAQLSMRQTPGEADKGVNDLYLTAVGVDPGSALLDRLDGVAGLGAVIDEVTLSARVRFDRPWDRRAIEVARPQPRDVMLEAFTARWGKLRLTGSGTLEIDADGEPQGEIALEAVNWREMVEIAEATGVLSEGEARRYLQGLTLVAALSGDPDTLDVTLRFERGLAFLGPLPLGAAPDLRLP